MNNTISTLLERYNPQTINDSIRALREIIQEIALVGLWRAKFFETAAFYGGTALRIFYNLDRFSEDLDFSLLEPNNNFSLESYNIAITEELKSFGFDVTVDPKIKNFQSAIESAFIKANTKTELINIGLRKFNIRTIPRDAKIKVKLEVDTNPPMGFETESKILSEPLPVAIRCYKPEYLFSGKMHALLCRKWQKRIKGRDWYDFVWFVRKNIAVNLLHLETRMHDNKCININTKLTKKIFTELLHDKINNLDIGNALEDIKPYVYDPEILNMWSKEYFTNVAKNIRLIS